MPLSTATRTSLHRDFQALGVAQGDLIMLHASFRAVRPVEGGPDTVIDAFLDAVGQDGGIVMFASWKHSTYDAFAAGGLSQQERAHWPVFDPATAEVRPTHGGAIGACLALRDGGGCALTIRIAHCSGSGPAQRCCVITG